MDPKEIEKQIKVFQDQMSKMTTENERMRKDFQLQLQSAKRDSETWKQEAEKREEEIRKFKEQAEKEKLEKEVAIKKSKEQEIKGFVSTLKEQGKLIPALEDHVVKLMESMTSEEEIMSFREKDGSMRKHNQLSLLKFILARLPKAVDYSETSYSLTVSNEGTPDKTFSDGDGKGEIEQFAEIIADGTVQRLPMDGIEIDKNAKQYMADMAKVGKAISYAEALLAVAPKKKIGS